jgi:hypothetical protein
MVFGSEPTNTFDIHRNEALVIEIIRMDGNRISIVIDSSNPFNLLRTLSVMKLNSVCDVFGMFQHARFNPEFRLFASAPAAKVSNESDATQFLLLLWFVVDRVIT